MKAKVPVIVVVFALIAIAAAKNNKLSPELQNPRGKAVNVIIQFQQAPTATQHQKVTNKGGHLKQELSTVKGAAYWLPVKGLKDLANDPDVVYISPDRTLGATGAKANNPGATLDYHTDTVNAPYAWGLGLNGAGIGVAVLDSGIIDIPDLEGAGLLGTTLTSGYRVIYSQNFVGNGTGSANDQYGHGSHVAGIIGGNGSKSTGPQYFYTFNGIAPEVNLINLRALDQNGQGTDSSVIAALQTAIQLKNAYNIRVINLSLGRPVYESYTLDPLCQAVEAAYQAGIVVVVAAGNDGRDNSVGTNGYGTITVPGNDPYVITVGAMKTMGTPSRADDLIATYSSKGPTAIDYFVKPDLVAPGNRVISLYAPALGLNQLYPGNEIPYLLYKNGNNSNASHTYYMLSGTSMAAPVVSGAVALMLQQDPSLTPDQVKARLMKTAYKAFPQYSSYTDPTTGITYNDQYDVFTVGAGYLDIQAALSDTETFTGAATSPTVAYDPTSQSVYFVNNSFAVWGSSSNWSSFAVWGSNAFVNGSFAVWGSSSPWASFAVWGSSAPWGNTADGGFFAVWGSSNATGSPSNADSVSTLINGDN